MSDDRLPPGYVETDVAIVGMAGRFPGATDVDAFWRNVRDGTDVATWLDEDELRAAGVPEEEIADPDYVPVCYPVEDMKGFDAAFFGFSPNEAAIMDPQQRHFLELAWTAMEHAGHDPARAQGAIGVFAAAGASIYLMQNLLTRRELVENVGFFLLRHTGNDKDFLATRVSYLMDLRGPSVNVQAACSSSLVALHLACQSLLMNECDVALAGGSTFKQPHRVGYLYREGEILSPDGRCRTFDARARGTVFGSGAGVVVLRRLEDALADGDTIHAVVKGTAVNNDGSSKVGYLAPSVDAQAANVAEALAISGVPPEAIGHIECHGTATPVGDPIEVLALTQAYAGSSAPSASIALGSVKTSVGHLDTAAGVAGLIKSVQALKEGVLPPSLHFEEPNPAIDFESGPFYVSAEARPWPARDGHRYAAVAALGVGGTNAHVVIQSPPAVAVSEGGGGWELVPLSAKTATALEAQASRLAEFLETSDAPLGDVANTLQVGRQPFAHRRFAVGRSGAEVTTALRAGDAKVTPGAVVSDVRRSSVFMFAGGGAQYPGMGRHLYEQQPVFRAAVDECVQLLQPRLDWSLTGLLYAPEEGLEVAAAEMRRPSRSLPCLFVTQYAMARLLMSWGIEPDAMIGHSMGEYTAAHLAGVFSLADALSLVTVRGKLFETVPPGGMLSVPLDAGELAERLPPELSIAAANAPGLSVASGPVEALDALESRLREDDIECSRIHIDIAAHSSMLDPILEEFGAFTAKISYSAPTRPFISNLTGTWIEAHEATDPQYWVRHLRHTVRFADGAGQLLSTDGRVLIEVGPGRVLATLAGLHEAKNATHETLTTMRHPAEETDDVAVALSTVGRLWLAGMDVDWSALAGGERRRRIPLPTYPFEHQEHFFEPGEVTAPKPTLARRADVGRWFWRPAWRKATLVGGQSPHLSDESWLVFRDETGVGAGVAQRLAAGGARVVSVLPGEAFGEPDAATYRVRPGSAEDMETLVRSLADGGFPTRVVHAWAAGPAPVDADRAFFSLLHLAQATGTEGIDEEMRIDVVTAGAQYVGGEGTLNPHGALALGPVRVLPKEFPNLRCRAVDFADAGAAGFVLDRAVRQLLAELAREGDEEVVAWRGGERFVQTFEEVALGPADESALDLGEGAVWMITGGLGGLGLLVARELAQRTPVRLVLTGRSAERRPVVDELEALGAEVLVVRADVTDEDDMRRAVSEAHRAFGRINGVVHAAGVVEDALVLLKDRESAERVLAPKVRGTQVLEAVLEGEPVERVVFFSSRGAFAGVAGQIDYTAASAYLDAHALGMSEIAGAPVVSLNWSAWAGVGLAAGGAAVGRPVEHPFLDRCISEEAERSVYQSRLAPDTHWLLDEHRLRTGEALVPGTGYIEIIAAAAAEVGPRSTLELQDVFFFSPFMVADGESRDLRVTVERDGADLEIAIEGRRPDAEEWEEHARGSVVTVDRALPGVRLEEVRARCGGRTVTFEGDEQRNANLKLGHRWDNLVRLDFGDGEALAELRLPSEYAGEVERFQLHPSLLDVASACAQELVPGFDTATQFFIPVSYGRVTVYGHVPAHCFSHIRLKPGAGADSETAVYDITILAEDDGVVADIADFTMMRVHGDASVARSAASGSSAGTRPLQFEGAIEPAEGIDALRRVAASGLAGQLVVSPQHLETYLAALREPEDPAAAGTDASAPEPAHDLVDASEVEMVLATHEAIEEVVVLAHQDSSGEVKASAFIVWELGEEVTIAEVRRFLKGNVPEALIPQQIVEMAELPRDAAGGVDRMALPDPFAPKDDYVAPSTETEKLIAAIWIELLGVRRVSVHDNFLDVGGHSLLAMRAISKIAKQTGVRLNPSVMTLNTLGQISAECDAVGASS